MERIAWLVIGVSLTVVLMAFLPAIRPDVSMPSAPDPKGAADASEDTSAMPDTMAMPDMGAMRDTGAMHRHPPREVSPDLPVPSLTHLMFPDATDGYNIQILVRDFAFTPAAIDREARDNEGHAHVYVNGEKVARVYSAWHHLPGALLAPGPNDVTVTLNANDHGEWSVGGTAISSTVRVHGAATAR